MKPMSQFPRDGMPVLLRVPESEHGWVVATFLDAELADEPEEEGWYLSEAAGTRIKGEPIGWDHLPDDRLVLFETMGTHVFSMVSNGHRGYRVSAPTADGFTPLHIEVMDPTGLWVDQNGVVRE